MYFTLGYRNNITAKTMECPVTNETYSRRNLPVSLPCGHTISDSAAQGICGHAPVIQTASMVRFRCPMCNADTNVAALHRFPTNYKLLDLLEEQTTHTQDHTSPPRPPIRDTPSSLAGSPVPDTPSSPAHPLLRLQYCRIGGKVIYKVRPHSDAGVDKTRRHVTIGIDQSYSMTTCISDSLGFNRLDLVKYNVEVLLSQLAKIPQDQVVEITILSYSNVTRVIAQNVKVTNDTLEDLVLRVQRIQPMGTTDIIGAMRKAFQLMPRNAHTHLVVLTDGQQTNDVGQIQPDDPSPYRILLAQSQYSTVSMIGYGSDLSTRLMRATAQMGHGVYSFGSDPSMISSVFLQFVAWLLTCMPIRKLTLYDNKTQQRILEVPMVSTDSYQSMVMDSSISAEDVCLRYQVMGEHGFREETVSGEAVPDGPDMERELISIHYSEALAKGLQTKSFEPIQRFLSNLSTSANSGLLACIREECREDVGQIWMAFRPQYFTKWGIPYIGSCHRAHEHRHSWNFKDAALKGYEGPDFRKVLADLTETFNMIPVPKPSMMARESVTAQGGMKTVFMDTGNTCFAEGSCVHLTSGKVIAISDLKIGMKIHAFNALLGKKSTATVQHIFRSPTNGSVEVCRVAEHALLTPNHPYLVRGLKPHFVWPRETSDIIEVSSPYVYNMVLDHDHIAMIGGVPCVTMGHGFTETAVMNMCYGGANVVAHRYFGSRSRVLADCSAIGRDVDGYITVDPTKVVRDPCTGWVEALSGSN